jgi:hypothetical protein
LLRRRNDPHLAAGILDAAQHQAEEFSVIRAATDAPRFTAALY